MASGESSPLHGWLLYDASCGICVRLMRLVEPVFVRRGFGAEALQSAWVKNNIGLNETALVADFRILLVDSRRIDGADAYRYLFRRVWWLTPLYMFSELPGCKTIFDRMYRLVADNRWRISRACGIRGE
jgi:predicted DCC family thiol-disulfide oxidoreductase YuxK